MICTEYAKNLGKKTSEDLSKSLFDNPYVRGTELYDAWIIGFLKEDRYTEKLEEDEILVDEF